MRTKELLALGVFGGRGSRLGDRIEILLRRGTFSERVSGTLLAAISAALLSLAALASLAPNWIAFAQSRLAFEVASIKPTTGADAGSTRFGVDGITVHRASLLELICAAYQMPYSRVLFADARQNARERYDVSAKAGRPASKQELLAMLQTLLGDRFKLKLHQESKVQPVYNLTVAKGGLKMTEGPRTPDKTCAFPQCMAIDNTEMWVLAATLSGRMGRPVLDRTGLTGSYSGALRLDIMEGLVVSDPDVKTRFLDWSSSSVFGDIEKQLGLKLEAASAPVETIIVDHAEAPDAN